MAFNFSANQFESRYAGKRLQNWELPKYYPTRPRQRRGSTKVIADDRGHLLPEAPRVKSSPFSNFRSTYQLPDKLTRRFAKDYNDCLQQRHKYASFERQSSTGGCGKKPDLNAKIDLQPPNCPTTCETVARVLSAGKGKNRLAHGCEKKSLDLEYIPGDYTPQERQHESRKFLLDQKFKRDSDAKLDYKIDTTLDLGLKSVDPIKRFNRFEEETKPPFSPPLPLTASLTTPLISPPIENYANDITNQDTLNFDMKAPPAMTHQSSITGKPHERCPSPVVPAYANFELAKRMHQENLDHQPLPDCVADLAYRKLQISGGQAGLALEIDPIATGVGIRTHNAGPTHCTKLKVFRPKTCGIVPKPLRSDAMYGSMNDSNQGKEMGAMDLAICWDYKPPNPSDEPQPPRHIDGSNGSVGPAVFTYVKTPRDEAIPNTGRSAGVFQSTLGETDFFDKDIMRRKTDFTGRNTEKDDFCGGCIDPPVTRARSVSRDYGASEMPNRLGKQYQSTPNILSDQQYKSLRDKYLGVDPGGVKGPSGPSCRRGNPGFFQRARTRLCHKVAPSPPTTCCHAPERPQCKAAFRVGVPKYDASGFFISSDSGCSTGSQHHGNRVLVIPRPRNPYMKKNYDIGTLVPPFTAINGGASQGGYPEHWRLASVYQHAFKPPAQRRRPLLETVYK